MSSEIMAPDPHITDGLCFACPQLLLEYFGLSGMSPDQLVWLLLAAGVALMVALSKFRSRRLTPKERVAELKRRRPIARKAHLKTCGNPLKEYREVPRWKLERWAMERRASQLDDHGMPIWPAELAFYLILRQLTQGIKLQEPFYTPQTFILADFYIPQAKLVFELDGSSHSTQIGYDAERDAWLKSLGIRTVRVPNRLALRNPRACEAMIRAELGLS